MEYVGDLLDWGSNSHSPGIFDIDVSAMDPVRDRDSFMIRG
jgi:hypothetical protein